MIDYEFTRRGDAVYLWAETSNIGSDWVWAKRPFGDIDEDMNGIIAHDCRLHAALLGEKNKSFERASGYNPTWKCESCGKQLETYWVAVMDIHSI